MNEETGENSDEGNVVAKTSGLRGRWFGHDHSIELIKRLKGYLSTYYGDIFFRLDPVLLKRDLSRNGLSSIKTIDGSIDDFYIQEYDVSSVTTFCGPSLLALCRVPGGSLVNSLFIFPLLAGYAPSNIVSNNLVDIIMGISDDCLRASEKDIEWIKTSLEAEYKGEETKYTPGIINKFDEHLNCFMDAKSLLAIYFDNNDFCLYEVNFSSALNYL